MPLSDAEYEDAYAEALLCLSDDGHVVGSPYINATGTRHCRVDNRLVSDQAVLELWWGKDLTARILKGRAGRNR